MYTIGKFSKMTGVPAKTLIWYDKEGVLKPKKVDADNGYRYYDDESLKKLIDIRFWQIMEFSIKDITDLSPELISDKIKLLKSKVGLIYSNIDILELARDRALEASKTNRTIDMSVFCADRDQLRGKWQYKQSTEDFNNLFLFDHFDLKGINDTSAPETLFFGANKKATDLKSVFDYNDDAFTIAREDGTACTYWCFTLNHTSTLVLCERPDVDDKSNAKMKFHLYRRCNDTQYSSSDINYLCLKYGSNKEISNDIVLDERLIGYWKMHDVTTERQIDTYVSVPKQVNTSFFIKPFFECLRIYPDNTVAIMEDGHELDLRIDDDKVKTLNAENTKMTLSMSGTTEGGFFMDGFLGNKNGQYREIDGAEYLFVTLSDIPDLDAQVHVFKKYSSDVNAK